MFLQMIIVIKVTHILIIQQSNSQSMKMHILYLFKKTSRYEWEGVHAFEVSENSNFLRNKCDINRLRTLYVNIYARG